MALNACLRRILGRRSMPHYKVMQAVGCNASGFSNPNYVDFARCNQFV